MLVQEYLEKNWNFEEKQIKRTLDKNVYKEY